MLRKVISGGQTGADRGALIAAKQFNLLTGGAMPSGFLAEDGLHPEFKELYGMSDDYADYHSRTTANVLAADLTICIATDWKSPGELLTKRLLRENEKEFYCVDPRRNDLTMEVELLGSELVGDIQDFRMKLETLNVAGNKESTSPGIQVWTVEFLTGLFDYLRENSCV